MNFYKIEGKWGIYPPYASRYEIEGETPCKTAGMIAERKMKQ